MQAKRLSVLLSLCVAALPLPSVCACTILIATDGDRVLVGNNEDWIDPNGRINFVPASPGRYGMIYFSHSGTFPQGGMNDQGLFFDGAATATHPVTSSANKPTFEGDLQYKIMRECATVEEALAVYDRYNLAFMAGHQTLIADATGDAAIIEGDTIVRKKGNYQIATNFRHSQTPSENIECGRYKIAEAMLSEADVVTVESVRDVLAAVHQEGKNSTQYSNVYDLKNRVVYVYHFHNFTNVVKFNLADELKQGARVIDLPSLFPATFAAENFAKVYAEWGPRWQLEAFRARSGLTPRPEVAVPTKTLEHYVGEYESDTHHLGMKIVLKNGKLKAEATGQEEFPLTAVSDNTFQFIDGGIEIVFDQKEAGFSLKQHNRTDVFVRTSGR